MFNINKYLKHGESMSKGAISGGGGDVCVSQNCVLYYVCIAIKNINTEFGYNKHNPVKMFSY